jgi:hypothetical protein
VALKVDTRVLEKSTVSTFMMLKIDMAHLSEKIVSLTLILCVTTLQVKDIVVPVLNSLSMLDIWKNGGGSIYSHLCYYIVMSSQTYTSNATSLLPTRWETGWVLALTLVTAPN